MTRSPIASLLIGLFLGAALGASSVLFLGGEAPGTLAGGLSRDDRVMPDPATPDVGAAERPEFVDPAGVVARHRAPGPSNQASAQKAAKPGPAGVLASAGRSGRIWGWVRDEEGNGVPGVVIRIWPEVSDLEVLDGQAIGASAPSLDRLKSDARARAAAWVAAQAQTIEVTTDAEGAFAVEGAAEQRWQANGHKEGLVVMPVQGSTEIVHPGAAYEFIARKRIDIPVRLLNGKGEPLESGVIVARSSNIGRDMRVLKWSDAEPGIPLEAGKWRLKALSGKVRERLSQRGRFDADLASGFYSVETPLAAGEAPIELKLVQPTALHGSLTTGASEKNAKPYTLKLARYVGADKPSMGIRNRDVLSRQVSAGASFTVQDLEPGRYLIALMSSSQGSVLVEETLDLVRGTNEHALEVPDLDLSQFVWLRCLDPGGEPVKASSVSMRVTTKGGGSWSGPVSSTRMANGGQLVELPGMVAETAEKGGEVTGIQLTVKHSSYSDVHISIDGAARQAEARFEGAGDLTVTVTGIPPGAHPGLRVHLQAKAVKVRSVAGRGVTPDDDGVAQWQRAQLGPCEILLMQNSDPESPFARPTVIHRQDAVVVPGSNSVLVAYPALYDLEVYVPKGHARTRVHIQPEPYDREGIHSNLPGAILGDDLRARISGLPAGQYSISCGVAREVVTVPSDPVTLER